MSQKEELPGKGQNGQQVQEARSKVFLENDTLIVIQDESTAIRRFDLEACSVLKLPSAPDFQIYYKTRTAERDGIRIIGISKIVNKEERNNLNSISNIMIEKLRLWNKELEFRLSVYKMEEFKMMENGAGDRNTARVPTLIDLLNLLCSDKITTSKQRKEIRDVINIYLVGEIHYNDVYNMLERIIGKEVLYHAIVSLGSSPRNDNIDFSWMIRSFDFDNESLLSQKLSSYYKIQDFFLDNSRVYPLIDFKSTENSIPYIGYSTVSCGPYVIFLGGIKETKSRSDGKKQVVLSSFENLAVLDTRRNFGITCFRSSSGAPTTTPSIYHSSNLILTQSGPKIVVSGGIVEESGKDNQVQMFDFSTSTSIFDMRTRVWTVQNNHSNTPRILHSTLTFPQFSTRKESKFIIVFGGLTKNMMNEVNPSNDMWIYSVKDSSWTQVAVFPAPNSAQTELPSPRFGHSMVWIDEKTFYIYGGEGVNTDEHTKKGVLLNDIWSFTINSTESDISNLYIKGYWTKIKTTGSSLPYSALHSSISLCVPKTAETDKNEDMGNNDKIQVPSFSCKDQQLKRKVLLFIGGVDSPRVSEYPLNLSDFRGLDFLFGRKKESSEVSSKESNIRLTVLDIQTNESRSMSNIKISVPSPTSVSIISNIDSKKTDRGFEPQEMFILNGITHFFEAYTTNRKISSPYLLLHGHYYDEAGGGGNPEINQSLVVLSLLGHEPFGKHDICQEDVKSRDHDCNEYGEEKKESSAESIILDKIKPFVRPVSRNTFTLSHSFFSALRSSQSWLFGAFSHLLDNSFSIKTGSTFADITVSVDFISVLDDGVGLCYDEMENLLRQFGAFRSEKDDKYRNDGVYGLGFKHAFSRISDSCIVLTKTKEFVGIGLISTKILGSEDILERKYWTPICYWHLDTLEPFIPVNSNIQEHNKKQKLIIKFGPLKSSEILCDHFSSIKSDTGTKFIFSCTEDTLKSHKYQYLRVSENGINLFNDEDHSLLNRNSNNRESHLVNVNTLVGDSEKGSQPLQSADNTSLKVPSCPFWESKGDSIDYCLSTYLTWLYLNKTQNIYCQGRLLSLNKDESSFQCLYDFLLSNLKKPVRLSRLIRNKNIENDGAYGIIGMVSEYSKSENEPLDPVSIEECNVGGDDMIVKKSNEVSPTICENSQSEKQHKFMEAGVLLYYNGRLIRRLESHFPTTNFDSNSLNEVTAVFNVPQWLIPASNKQEFVLERTGIFEEFQDSVYNLVKEYLKLSVDDVKLKEWESEFNSCDDVNNSNYPFLRPSKLPKIG